jgi:L-ribulose-5-phosphate 3-epimerase
MTSALQNTLGIYEKAFLSDMSWEARLEVAEDVGFDFIEMSIDESDQRLARLNWTQRQRDALNRAVAQSGISIPMMAISALRKYPMGSLNDSIRQRSLGIVRDSIRLADDIGAGVVQLAGYDVFYEDSSEQTRNRFLTGVEQSVRLAETTGVILSLEVMDIEYTSSVARLTEIVRSFDSPSLRVYADFGNICAWGGDLESDLEAGKGYLMGVHVKDSLPNTFRRVPFGEGIVDFVSGFRKLREMQYAGPFSIEMWCDEAANYREAMSRARQWVAKKMEEASRGRR